MDTTHPSPHRRRNASTPSPEQRSRGLRERLVDERPQQPPSPPEHTPPATTLTERRTAPDPLLEKRHADLRRRRDEVVDVVAEALLTLWRKQQRQSFSGARGEVP